MHSFQAHLRPRLSLETVGKRAPWRKVDYTYDIIYSLHFSALNGFVLLPMKVLALLPSATLSWLSNDVEYAWKVWPHAELPHLDGNWKLDSPVLGLHGCKSVFVLSLGTKKNIPLANIYFLQPFLITGFNWEFNSLKHLLNGKPYLFIYVVLAFCFIIWYLNYYVLKPLEISMISLTAHFFHCVLS